MKPRSHSITICGDEWTYSILPQTDYDEDPELVDSTAYTDKRARRMVFCAEKFSRGAVVHELFHAYCKYLYLNSASISQDDFEEIVAEMLEDKIDIILTQTKEICRCLKKSLTSI